MMEPDRVGPGTNRPAVLNAVKVSGWPRLGWVAIATHGHESLTVLHGECVETTSSWCAEAVWNGEFKEGGFDQAGLVCGTGVRVREQDVCFVSSADALNRLHWQQSGGTTIVSNSLPALLAVADVDLVDDYAYADAMSSIVNGLRSYQRTIPSTGGPIHLAYFNNLVLRGEQMVEAPKHASAPAFVDFSTYRDFLYDAAKRLGRNATAAERRHAVGMLTTVSSGYDSGAASVIAREAGTRHAVTVRRGRREATNLFSLDDSGASVARQLSLSCTAYERDRRDYPFEDAAWASMGNVGDVNLSLFEYPGPVCLLFTGFMGDTMWATDTVQPEPLRRRASPSGARFSELRLELGVITCAPAFWGCENEPQILRLSHLPEMRPWTLNGNYDRPIPRRLLEDAGVRRGTFAVRKRVSSFNRRYGKPLSASLREDFARFMAQRGRKPGSWLAEQAALVLGGIDWVFLSRLPAPLRVSCRDWAPLPTPSDFFVWANRRCKARYLRALQRD